MRTAASLVQVAASCSNRDSPVPWAQLDNEPVRLAARKAMLLRPLCSRPGRRLQCNANRRGQLAVLANSAKEGGANIFGRGYKEVRSAKVRR